MRWRGLLRLAVLLLAILAAASWGVSRALAGGWGRRQLLARLSASFGRPVEVGRFDFNFLEGPQLEADSVTVAEDPRFGNEYFLRADQITASLAWSALLRGKIEFRTLSLSRPSLNLVRTPDGNWNIENWLPPVPVPPPGAPRTLTQAATAAEAARVAHIEVDGGRINFKRGVEKLQFALVEVTGTLDQDSSGRWSLDLQARPARASVALQESGVLRLRGSVAGTSARLRPARLNLTWEDTSLADALRLATGTDYGIRGTLGAEFTASIDNPSPTSADASSGQWQLQGMVRLAEVHRWDLAARPADPAINLSLVASWRPGEPSLAVSSYSVDAPRSHLSGLARIDWARGIVPTIQVTSSDIAASDLLAWRRSFTFPAAEDLSINATLHLNGRITGWPPEVQEAALTTEGGTITTGALPGLARVNPLQGSMRRNLFVLTPLVVNLPGPKPAPTNGSTRGSLRAAPVPDASSGAFRMNWQIGPFRAGASLKDLAYQLGVSGETTRVQDVIRLAAAFGWPIRSDWTFDGAATFDLAWKGTIGRPEALSSGNLGLRDIRLSSAFLNQPVTITAANVQLAREDERVTVVEAHAFGARWAGTMERSAANRGWSFDVSADHLDVEDLDRWLGPRARLGFFQRMLPFAAPSNQSSVLESAIAKINGKGRLRIDELSLAPLLITRVDANADFDGRNVRLTRAQADLYNGHITGDFAASVTSQPSYSFHGTMDRVNVGMLANVSSGLKGRFAGIASGELTLTAKGIGRSALLASLQGTGALRVRDAVIPIVDPSWAQETRAAPPLAVGVGRFASAVAAFHVVNGGVRLDSLRLADHDREFEVTGLVDSARRLDLRVRLVAAPSDSAGPLLDSWGIAGTFESPRIVRMPSVAASAGNSTPARH